MRPQFETLVNLLALSESVAVYLNTAFVLEALGLYGSDAAATPSLAQFVDW